MGANIFIRKAREDARFFSMLSWGRFGEGIRSIFNFGMSEPEIKFKKIPTTATVRRSWEDVCNAINDAYVEETSHWR